MLSQVSDSVQQIKSYYQLPALSTTAEYERISQYVTKFSERMSSLLRISGRLSSMESGESIRAYSWKISVPVFH